MGENVIKFDKHKLIGALIAAEALIRQGQSYVTHSSFHVYAMSF